MRSALLKSYSGEEMRNRVLVARCGLSNNAQRMIFYLMLRRWRAAGLILIAIAILIFRAEATPAFLHTKGQDIVNESGERILLRGVGLGNWMLPEGYMWKFGDAGDRPRRIEQILTELIGPENARRFWTEFHRNYITEDDIKRIRQLGYNSVRPALNS